MDEAVAVWLEYADGDLSTAEFLYEKQWPRQLEIICYHCQQAGEKAVKALYLAANIPGGIPRKHDLWFLLEQIKGQVSVDPLSTSINSKSENVCERMLLTHLVKYSSVL